MITQDWKHLRKTSLSLPSFDQNLEKILMAELTQHETGVGISAIQVGIPARMCIVKIGIGVGPGSKYITLWNPEIRYRDDMRVVSESCLSLPGITIPVTRCYNIEVKNGDGQKLCFNGFTARIVQHEIDHMNGILITDHEPGDYPI